MKSLKKIIRTGIVLGLTALVAGCSSYTVHEKQDKATTISGVPVSVSFNPAYDHVSTVVSTGNEMILCEGIVREGGDGRSKTSRNLIALVQSEINDGDNEEIKLKGYYGEDYGKKAFDFNELDVQGYHINLNGGQ